MGGRSRKLRIKARRGGVAPAAPEVVVRTMPAAKPAAKKTKKK